MQGYALNVISINQAFQKWEEIMCWVLEKEQQKD